MPTRATPGGRCRLRCVARRRGIRTGTTLQGNYFNRTTGGGKWSQRENSEPTEDLWERKHEEAYDEYQHPVKGRATEYNTERDDTVMTSGGRHVEEPGTWGVKRPGTPAMSLGESIEETGVQSPIRLGSRIGSEDKPQIVGGHHRLAVQTQLDPNKLVPVLHHDDIWEARSPNTQMAWPYS